MQLPVGKRARKPQPAGASFLKREALAPELPRPPRPLISDIAIEHGPLDLLGRFFLKADTEARMRGVTLTFAPMQDLIDVNHSNPQTWRPILPLFDPASGGITEDNAFCILGYNTKGEIVATQAARLYCWSGTSFHEEASSLRLFYADPDQHRAEGEQVEVTAPIAKKLTGAVIFAGGIWYRPDYRNVGLPYILPWLSRAYAYTRWKHKYSMSIMAEEVYAKGMARRSGYSKADWEVWLRNTPVDPTGNIRCALVWMDEDDLLGGVEEFLSGSSAKVDVGVHKRRA